MNMEETRKLVGEQLFSDTDAKVFTVLDGTSIPDLLDKLYGLSPTFCCLYRGELEPDMAEVAPYLVQLEQGSEFTDWLLEGWGKHWGIFAISDADFRAMRRHFRSFLIVNDENGRPLRFRYYDPRVLRLYLPTCNAEELRIVFGSVINYLLEDEDSQTILRFHFASNSLSAEKISVRRD